MISSLLAAIGAGFVADLKQFSLPVAALRLLRALRLVPMARSVAPLLTNPALRGHVAAVAKDDALFFITHRHYLACGLTAAERVRCARRHYEHEVAAFDQGYFDAVYRGRGLLLWQHDTGEGVFDICLQPGNDVLYQGNMSVVAHFEGERICVVSYSVVDRQIFLPGTGGDGNTLFVTRKQLTAERGYQKVFNKAFDRSTPGHFCFAALAGIGAALGHTQLVAITPEVHPSCSDETRHHFETAYTEFWESLHGSKSSPYGYVLDLPMRMTPLEQLDAKARKRALARRQHIDAVHASALAAVAPHLAPAASLRALPSTARLRPEPAGRIANGRRWVLGVMMMLA